LWLSSSMLSALVALTMLFTVAEHMNIFSFCLSLSFNFSFAQHQHQFNCLTVIILLRHSHLHNAYQSQTSIMALMSFIRVFFCVWYWHWLQGRAHDGAHDCEKCVASSSVSVTSVKHACVAVTVPSSLSSEVVNSSHTSVNLIFFSVAATLLTSCSCDLLIVLICFCCLWCSKVIVTLLNHKCEVMKNVQCSRCFKNHKACDSICKMLMKHRVWLTFLQISVKFFNQMNKLLTAVAAISKRKNTGKKLINLQTIYIKAVETHLHVVKRHKLHKRLTSAVEVKLLQLKEVRRQTCLFKEMLNLYCAVVCCCFPFAIPLLC